MDRTSVLSASRHLHGPSSIQDTSKRLPPRLVATPEHPEDVQFRSTKTPKTGIFAAKRAEKRIHKGLHNLQPHDKTAAEAMRRLAAKPGSQVQALSANGGWTFEPGGVLRLVGHHTAGKDGIEGTVGGLTTAQLAEYVASRLAKDEQGRPQASPGTISLISCGCDKFGGDFVRALDALGVRAEVMVRTRDVAVAPDGRKVVDGGTKHRLWLEGEGASRRVGTAEAYDSRQAARRANRSYEKSTLTGPLGWPDDNSFFKKDVPDLLPQAKAAHKVADTQDEGIRTWAHDRGIVTPAADALADLRDVDKRWGTAMAHRLSDAKKRQLRDIAAKLSVFDQTRKGASYELDLVDAFRKDGLPGVLERAQSRDRTIPWPVLESMMRTMNPPALSAQASASLETAIDAVHRHDFERFLIGAAVNTDVDGLHTSAQAADARIRGKLDQWGVHFDPHASITGNVAVLSGEAWAHLIRARFAGRLPPGKINDLLQTANAFEADGRVFINANRGNPGTMIHEGVHRYAPRAFLDALGEDLNEGATEFFARQIYEGERTQYKDDHARIDKLVAEWPQGAQKGWKVLRDAYFLGNRRAIQAIRARLGQRSV
ncbi:MAG: C80 family cysteine peptidase [Myxococcota bacterium]